MDMDMDLDLYLDMDMEMDLDLDMEMELDMEMDMDLDLDMDLEMDQDMDLDQEMDMEMDLEMDMLEKDIEKQIYDWLDIQCEFKGNVWIVKVQGTFDQAKRIRRSIKDGRQRNGISDIIAFGYGFFWAIEVKRPKARKNTTPAQRHFLEAAQANNQISFIATCIEDVRDRIDKIRPVHK